MGIGFWSRRFGFAFVVAGVLLFLVRLAKGDAPAQAAVYALAWGAAAAAVYAGVIWLRWRRNPACFRRRQERG
ncbi:hypothetical protein CKO44_09100 [Rubrivivax gelatinosus]|uniref:hypothetical protein n=1 Tax=Rubrivivax gelatinosus TaxID=28068 RepID=UPI001902CB90|nr:hypothetical protein [Rubrivivax gelatinosus]MBK1613626.1 hypothetical protein [Rubrivivax gelatinosus]